MNKLSLEDRAQPPLLSDTPFSAASTTLLSPPLASSMSIVEDMIPMIESDERHPFTHAANISTDDVRSDPILSKLARGQGLIPHSPEAQKKASISFRARPVPGNMRDLGVGPKLSKAAALRMGMEWDEKKGTGERRAVDFANTPGHKRNNLSLDISSLSRPSLTPRANRTSQLRSGDAGASTGPIRRTPAEVSASIKAKADEDKARRRQSMTLPASLSAPTIMPRMNKTSMLRTGGPSTAPPVSSDRYLTSTSTSNVPPTRPTQAVKPQTPAKVAPDAQATPKEEKRSSIMGSIRSLGAPSIAPRLNRSALLRAPQAALATVNSTESPPKRPAASSRPPPSSYRPNANSGVDASDPPTVPLSRASSNRDTARVPRPPSGAGTPSGPRPTKASLLRAGLGAKVQTGR